MWRVVSCINIIFVLTLSAYLDGGGGADLLFPIIFVLTLSVYLDGGGGPYLVFL